MIISASRRTDIPAFHVPWLLERIEEQSVRVANPFNRRDVRVIDMDPSSVDCIVFWTKNPAPLVPVLDCLAEYVFYVQYTVTPYGREIEPFVPDLKDRLDVFRAMSQQLGAERVIWRYDPVFFTSVYTLEYHVSAFASIGAGLADHTCRCMISFLDIYKKTEKEMNRIGVQTPLPHECEYLARELKPVCARYGIDIYTCCEEIDLSMCGITHGACVDAALISTLRGEQRIGARKDKNQRTCCRCVESADIGAYNTCGHGCLYCYANRNPGTAARMPGELSSTED